MLLNMSGSQAAAYASLSLCTVTFMIFLGIAIWAVVNNGTKDITLINKKSNESSQDVRNYIKAVEHIPNWSRNGLFTSIYALVLGTFVLAILTTTSLSTLTIFVISSIVLVVGYVLMLMAVQCNQSYFSYHVLQDGGTHFR